jgi:membrane-bound lytic murein transglycosylase B
MSVAETGGASNQEPAPVVVSDADVIAFWEGLAREAAAKGVNADLMRRASAGFKPDVEIAALNANQPEFVRTAGAYLDLLVSEKRIADGKAKLAEHAALLEQLEARFGVDRHVLLAIWGIESAFGTSMGERSVVRSLATLALTDQRRAPFWRSELIAALTIVQRGDSSIDAMKGSWAGAMGHTQFMPSTFLAHAFDWTGDGKRDIWGVAPDDGLASAANYLRVSGWVAGQPAIIEVRLPKGFDYALAAPAVTGTLGDWRGRGITIQRTDLALQDQLAGLSLILPAGYAGPAFLTGANFRALLRYNRAVPYALAVAHLAERLRGAGPFATPWPVTDVALSRAEREELQTRLTELGHDLGPIDGIIGTATRAAIRSQQQRAGVPADGHPDGAFLNLLRKPSP